MGVSITATNSSYDFDMGYVGFFILRENIALAMDKDFGENYSKLGKCFTKEQVQKNDEIANQLISRKKLDEQFGGIIDFLYKPDVRGEIPYTTCGQIYEIIKDIDFGNEGFRYGVYRNNDYEDFKMFLKECYSKRRKMRWS